MQISLKTSLTCAVMLIYGTVGSGCASSGGAAPNPVSETVVLPPPPPPPPPVVQASDDGNRFKTEEYTQNYGLEQINAAQAYAQGASGKDIVVALIDSGVLSDHVELAGRISPFSTDIIDSDMAVTDTDGHGTAVASIIAGVRNGENMHGLAYESTILSIRANQRTSNALLVDNCGQVGINCVFYDDDIARAIDYAVDHEARVINLSLAGASRSSDALQAALERAAEANVTIVTAAGNAGLSMPDSPASFAGTAQALGRAIAVGATDSEGIIASFSNQAGRGASQPFFLVAPGVDIPVASLDPDAPESREYLTYKSGTSYAAPYVSGALALLFDAFPDLSPEAAVSILIDTAQDLGTPGVDSVYGAGLIDLEAAFRPQGASKVQFKGASRTVNMTDVLNSRRGAFGDWAEAHEGLSGLMFEDDYGRKFNLGASSHLAVRSEYSGQLQTELSGYRKQHRSRQFGLGTQGRFGFGEVRLYGQEDRSGFAYHTPLQALEQAELEKPSFEAALHMGRLHMGAGQGYGMALSGQAGQSAPNVRGAYSLVGEASWFSVAYDLTDKMSLATSVISGTQGTLNLLRVQRQFLGHGLSAEMGVITEKDHTFGGRFLQVLGSGVSAASQPFYSLGWQAAMPFGWHVQGRIEYVQADMSVANFAEISRQPFSMAWSFSARRQLSIKDSLYLDIYQPLRAEGGAIRLGIPVGVDAAQATIFEERTLNLTPSGREYNAKLNYQRQLGAGFAFSASAQFTRNRGHSLKGGNEYLSWVGLRGRW